MPVTEIEIPTLTADSVAEQPIFAPTYPEGYPDTGWHIMVSPAPDFNNLPVISKPEGMPVRDYEGSYELRSGLMLITIISLLLITMSLYRGLGYFRRLLQAPFSSRTRENAFEERTINETFFLTALIVNNCIVQGSLLYHILDHYDVLPGGGTIVLLLSIASCSICFMFQWVMIRALGFTFATPETTKIWTKSYNATQAILGIMLIPVALLLNIHAGNAGGVIWWGIVCYLIMHILFIAKTFRIFFNKISAQVYFILYLCSVELVPVVLCVAGPFIIYMLQL